MNQIKEYLKTRLHALAYTIIDIIVIYLMVIILDLDKDEILTFVGIYILLQINVLVIRKKDK